MGTNGSGKKDSHRPDSNREKDTNQPQTRARHWQAPMEHIYVVVATYLFQLQIPVPAAKQIQKEKSLSTFYTQDPEGTFLSSSMLF